MKKGPGTGREKEYFSDTIRERPLPPIPPTEDTLNSNLNNDSNLGAFVENFFQSDKRGNGFTEEDYASGDQRHRERATRRDNSFSGLDNIQALIMRANRIFGYTPAIYYQWPDGSLQCVWCMTHMLDASQGNY